jgi:hypothetical protein
MDQQPKRYESARRISLLNEAVEKLMSKVECVIRYSIGNDSEKVREGLLAFVSIEELQGKPR